MPEDALDIENPRRHVNLHQEFISNVSTSDFPGHYYGEDNSWNSGHFERACQVKVQKLSQRSIEFDVEHVDASIANAIRRVLIAEVPTIAIENIYIWNNTSVIQDEVLSHRIGLVPLNIDPRLIEYKEVGEQPTDRDTVVFRLNIECQRNNQAPKDSKDPTKLYNNSEVFSSHIEWVSQGEQDEMFKDGPSPGPTNTNIMLAKLRPGQEIEMEMHAIKGVGSLHAKWSPVATASYRLLPHINLLSPIPPHLCDKFAECFAPGVVKVTRNKKGDKEVKVVQPRKDTVSREVLRHPEFEGLVELARVKDFFLFNVESEGPYKPEDLPSEAIKVLRDKIAVVKRAAMGLQEDLREENVEMEDCSIGPK